MEALSNRILDKLFKDDHLLSEEEYALANYHLSILLINMEKCLVVYGVAFIFHAMVSTFCMHIVFVLLRRYAGGWHAASSLNCTVVSTILFVGFPMIADKVVGEIPIWASILLQALILLIVLRYAPADTEKNPLFEKKLRRKMRIQAVSFVLASIICYYTFFLRGLQIAMLLGEIAECVMIHPLFYRVLKRSYQNYGNYSAENED